MDQGTAIQYFASQSSAVVQPEVRTELRPAPGVKADARTNSADFASQSSAVVQPEVRTELRPAPGVKADARTNSAGLLGASPIESQVQKVSIASSTPFNYSSAQGIHRWLDGNVLVEIDDDDDDDDVIIVLPDECPSIKWNTIDEAASASASQYLSRCKACRPCQRIDKVIRLTALLKRQRKIECLTYEPVAGPSSAPDYSIVKEEQDGSYTTELLPRHPHLMIKIRVLNANTGQYSACLIPRSDAKGSAVFNLEEKEPILDQMIESLNQSFGDAPSKQISEAVDKNVPCSKQVQEGTEAPTFYPTVEEFEDPFTYIEKIWHRVKKFGLCKIVPPEGFVPTCNIAEEIRFAVSNQYVNRLFNRWGEASRTMGAITAGLRSLRVDLKKAQMIQGVETNLVKLLQTVDKNGGIETVINKRKWTKIAEDMNVGKHPHVRRKLEFLYYTLLPFFTLTVEEREAYFNVMDSYMKTTNAKLLRRARNPLYRRNRLLGATDSSSDSDYDMEYEEECVHHTGATMNVAGFKKIAGIVSDQLFNTKAVSLKDYEHDYWHQVQSGSEHICVYSASIDTGQAGYGFTKNPSDEYSKHPWNLKMLSQNPANMLRPLGAVVGVTVPTLHLGMIFSTSCWHRDPHGLPWIEYLHQGEAKIWYSVPESQDAPFRGATEALCPIAVQNKSIWLPSDIAMIPPDMLRARGVTVCRTEQLAGEFILVMPKAYSCSFSTGYGVSESTYLATRRWLPNLLEIFSEIRESSEPTMFSLEQLLKLTAEDEKTELSVLQIIQPALVKVFTQEIENRQLLLEMGVELQLECTQSSRNQPKAEDGRATGSEQTAWNVRDQSECEYCRCPLYLSEVRNLPTQGSTLCVEHALLLLRQPKYSTVAVSSVTMVYSYSVEQLRRTLKTVENRLATGGRV